MRDAGGGIATQNCSIHEAIKKTVWEEFEERFIKTSLDVIIIKAVKNGVNTGYDILSFIQRKFHMLLSAGTVYSILYSLERKGLLRATFDQRARCYSLTEKGEETLAAILTLSSRIKELIGYIF